MACAGPAIGESKLVRVEGTHAQNGVPTHDGAPYGDRNGEEPVGEGMDVLDQRWVARAISDRGDTCRAAVVTTCGRTKSASPVARACPSGALGSRDQKLFIRGTSADVTVHSL